MSGPPDRNAQAYRPQQARREQWRTLVVVPPRGERNPLAHWPRLPLREPRWNVADRIDARESAWRSPLSRRRSKRVFLGKLLVSDQPVRPKIRHSHFQVVAAGTDCARDVDPVWRLPQGSDAASVDEH